MRALLAQQPVARFEPRGYHGPAHGHYPRHHGIHNTSWADMGPKDAADDLLSPRKAPAELPDEMAPPSLHHQDGPQRCLRKHGSKFNIVSYQPVITLLFPFAHFALPQKRVW